MGEFLGVHEYKNVLRWVKRHPPAASGKARADVNPTYGDPSSQLYERHAASDFDTKTQDKLTAAN
ncbi:MAG TPA: hypothetical protein VMF50_09130 [Candidatus Binataceae bacterium]|nr:hypothetical protein [Candidatus Binataceae bacterium]